MSRAYSFWEYQCNGCGGTVMAPQKEWNCPHCGLLGVVEWPANAIVVSMTGAKTITAKLEQEDADAAAASQEVPPIED